MIIGNPNLRPDPEATGINVPLLREIQKHIFEEPHRLIMNDVIRYTQPGQIIRENDIEFEAPSCGAVACIAGWACLLVDGIESVVGMTYAGQLLGMSDSMTDVLFLRSHWPLPYQHRWQEAEAPIQRAQIVSDLIDEVIVTDGNVLR